jgi:hypothetical protein
MVVASCTCIVAWLSEKRRPIALQYNCSANRERPWRETNNFTSVQSWALSENTMTDSDDRDKMRSAVMPPNWLEYTRNQSKLNSLNSGSSDTLRAFWTWIQNPHFDPQTLNEIECGDVTHLWYDIWYLWFEITPGHDIWWYLWFEIATVFEKTQPQVWKLISSDIDEDLQTGDSTDVFSQFWNKVGWCWRTFHGKIRPFLGPSFDAHRLGRRESPRLHS